MMRRTFFSAAACLLLGLVAGHAAAGSSLSGKTFIIELSSSQSASGYAAYLVPPLAHEIRIAGLKPVKSGPGADVVFNVVTNSDVGQWMETGSGREWLYTVTVTVGVSDGSYVIPVDGTPQFGVAVALITPNSDREDELACLIGLATREAISRYGPKGIVRLSGQSCLRKE